MKRNIKTLIWMAVVVLLIIIMWFIPTQMNPIQSENDASSSIELPLNTLFFEVGNGKKESFNVIRDSDDFSVLSNDFRMRSKYTRLKDSILELFPITNRPNIRSSNPINYDESVQLWYTPFYMQHNSDNLSFDYTIIDTESVEFVEKSYDFPEQKYHNYDFISYAEDDDVYFILVTLKNYEYQTNDIYQLTIDKENYEVIENQKVDTKDKNLISTYHQTKSNPGFHYLIESIEMVGNSSMYQNEVNENIILLDPVTLEFKELTLPVSQETDEEYYSRTPDVFVDGSELYVASWGKARWNKIGNYDIPNLGDKLVVYKYNFEKDTFEESWEFDTANYNSAVLDTNALYMTTIIDGKTSQVDQVDLTTGDVINTEKFNIDPDSDYEFIYTGFEYNF